MTLLSHLGHPLLGPSVPARPQPISGGRVFAVQRLGAVAVGLILLAFGILGAAGGAPFLSASGERHLGMGSNGLLSGLSLVVAAILLGAALRGPRTASTTMITLGVLFLVSGLTNLAVISTAYNVLAFELSNVAFSFVVGLVLLVLGAYGRISGNLPDDSPYAHPHDLVLEPPDRPSDLRVIAADAAMREAEIAVVQHYATEAQRRRVRAMAGAHTREERRRIWMEDDVSAG